MQQPYDLSGKVAIVTGAGSGIGHALTQALLSTGCSVILADLKLRPEAEATVDRYPLLPHDHTHGGNHSNGDADKKTPPPPSTREPGNVDSNGDDVDAIAAAAASASAFFVPTDVTDWTQLQNLWDTSLKLHGRVDVVVSVAGIYEPPWSNFWKPPGISAESRDPVVPAAMGQYATIAVNQVAPIRLAQLAVDHWTTTGRPGNFLAVASISAYLHSIETPLYMASKAGLVSFVKSLGPLNELRGIRMAALCPGSVLTPIFEPEWNRKLTAEDVALTPEECAAVCVRVLREPQWGSGSVVETQKFGPKTADDEASVEVRDVKLEALYPLPGGKPNKHVIESRQRLVSTIREKGMRG